MKKVLFASLALLAAVYTYAGGKKAQTDLADILKNPNAYQGKIVEVIGYSTIEFEGNALYIDQGSQATSKTDKGLWLEIAKTPNENAKFTGKKVFVKGKFNASNNGHLGAWKGGLEDVSTFEIIKDGKTE